MKVKKLEYIMSKFVNVLECGDFIVKLEDEDVVQELIKLFHKHTQKRFKVRFDTNFCSDELVLLVKCIKNED